MNTNIIPIQSTRHTEEDVFIRACNSPAQQARREARRKAQQTKTRATTATLHTALIVLGMILGALI